MFPLGGNRGYQNRTDLDGKPGTGTAAARRPGIASQVAGAALLRPRPLQNRTCQFPGIRLKQAARALRAGVLCSCVAGR
jgi:hypothetical protein